MFKAFRATGANRDGTARLIGGMEAILRVTPSTGSRNRGPKHPLTRKPVESAPGGCPGLRRDFYLTLGTSREEICVATLFLEDSIAANTTCKPLRPSSPLTGGGVLLMMQLIKASMTPLFDWLSFV
jgi:hypothetical protein